MRLPLSPLPASRRSVALLSTLAILVLVTILSVGLTLTMMHEGSAARGHRDRQAALQASDAALASALSTLRDAIGTNAFWASQPGRVVVFNADGSLSNAVALYSPVSTNGSVDLNQRSWSGAYPVGGAATAAMTLGWVNLLRNPSAAAASNNAVIARCAWWIDDESSRVNVNTADGSAKGTAASAGEGYPTEASLAALGGTFASQAAAVGAMARTNGFAAEGEVARAGVSSSDVDSNRFNLTAFSRSSEMNLFGEPKIYLMSVGKVSTTPPLTLVRTNQMVGPYGNLAYPPTQSSMPPGALLTQIYPSTNWPNFVWAGAMQGIAPPSLAFPQYPYTPQSPFSISSGNGTDTNNPNYLLTARIAQYLAGYNGKGAGITWPSFPGSSGGFATKYTPRQLDNIALQIVSLGGESILADGAKNVSVPAYFAKGPLSGQPVVGIGRGPRLTQAVVSVTPVSENLNGYDYLQFQIEIDLEWIFPSQFAGGAITPASQGGAIQYGNSDNHFQVINTSDLPGFATDSEGLPTTVTGPSPLSTSGAPGLRAPNSCWMDNLLHFTVNAGSDPSTGNDLAGQDAGVDLMGNDPAQPDPDTRAAAMHPWLVHADHKAYGSGLTAGAERPAFYMTFPEGGPGVSTPWLPGERRISRSYMWNVTGWPTRPGVLSVNLDGGLAVWANTGSIQAQVNGVPFDSLHGTSFFGETMTSANAQAALAAVIPIHMTNLQPGITTTVHHWVSDPFVNLFPADWTQNADDSLNPLAAYLGGNLNALTTDVYPGYLQTGADPGAIWMPPQLGTIPQSQRFPNAGLLQFVRTGMFPDIANEPANPKSAADPKFLTQAGTPWRTFSLAPSGDAGQKTAGGVNYPDWAMLDLFTVPAMPQPLGGPYRDLTYGGATSGRINPNGGAIQPASWGAARPAPLAAVFQGMPVVTYAAGIPATNTLSASDAARISTGIAAYLAGNGIGAFRTPGEIANVPEVAAYLDKARSRNDVARQALGLLATRSNVFSVWVVGQSIQKAKGNTSYGNVETNDQVTDEIRMRYVIERYLDPGPTGIEDGVQPVANIPAVPGYKYRVIYAEQLDN